MMRTVVLGSGVTALVTGYFLNAPVLGALGVDHQSKNKFPLGPRILHKCLYSDIFLAELGISAQPRVFTVGHFEGDLKTGDFVEPTKEWQQRYTEKTRGPGAKLESAMSGGKTKILGWDMNEIRLVDKLLNYVRIIPDEVLGICLNKRQLLFPDRDPICFDKLYNTISARSFYKLCFAKSPYKLIANKTKFILAKGGALGDLLAFSGFNYIYFANKSVPYNRITALNGGLYVVEIPENVSDAGLLQFYTLKGMLVLDEMEIPDCQIISPKLDISGAGFSVKMVGRYARWNHSIKLNDVIEEMARSARSSSFGH